MAASDKESFLFFLLFCVFVVVAVSYDDHGIPLTPGKYNTSSGPLPGKLNIHFVAHSHDDVGWLKNIDQYYYGANNSITRSGGVQYILDSVVQSLLQNPDRKFIYVEMAYFKRWWEEQTDDLQATVRQLIQTGQLEFINGGWCMSDEAAPFYVDMVDQQTLGHQFLLNNFGPWGIPSVGWQIDPFGHSTTMATLYSLMGMNAWYFGRCDYQDRVERFLKGTLEMIMLPSRSLGPKVAIFTQCLDGYGSIPGYDYEWDSADPPVQDDPRLEDVNVKNRIDWLLTAVLGESVEYRSEHILLPFGGDFDFSNANTWFKNMDKLIHYLNIDGRVNAFYSTPSIYTQSKYSENITWTTKKDDFFPLGGWPHQYWTGYYTSRPALKGYVRSASNYLQICRQIELQMPIRSNYSSLTLWEAMAVAQHHDAVSGTEKQHVAYDYALRIAAGMTECDNVVFEGLSYLMNPSHAQMAWSSCAYLNQSICEATTQGLNVSIVVYNPLGRARSEIIRVPVSVLSPDSISVVDSSLNAIPFVLSPLENNTSESLLVFTAMDVPAMGFISYFLLYQSTAERDSVEVKAGSYYHPTLDGSETISIENEIYALTFDPMSGHLSLIENKASGISTQVDQYLAWYNSSDGNTAEDMNRGQASGAYIFRPNCTEDIKVACKPFQVNPSNVSIAVFSSSLVQEIRQNFSSWASQTFRLYANMSFIEVEFNIGPIPIDDGLGKEVVSRFETDLSNNYTIYTDANGREMQTRIFNYRPTWDLIVTDPVSGNYYPVNSVISMKDENASLNDARQLSVLTDRSQGGAGLDQGSLELMLHRRLLHDDNKGVGEPLNEPGTDGRGLAITGIQRIIFDTGAAMPALRHDHQDRLTFPVSLSFTPLDAMSPAAFAATHSLNYSGLVSQLPPNIHLMTTQLNEDFGGLGNVIFRLSHSFEVNEDPLWSRPVIVNVTSVFSGITLVNCSEMSLTANQQASQIQRDQWKYTNMTTNDSTDSSLQQDGDVVTIFPMEIRTFSCFLSQ